MTSELDALRTAQLLLQQHGAQEAWRILTARALDEHLSGQTQARGITLAIQAALHKLTDGPEGKALH